MGYVWQLITIIVALDVYRRMWQLQRTVPILKIKKRDLFRFMFVIVLMVIQLGCCCLAAQYFTRAHNAINQEHQESD